jgi:glycosyltransferase involved in cell wall biosynthesis
LRILHVIPGLANASGPTHVVTRYAERFVMRGHEVSVFHVSGRGKDAVVLPAGIDNRSFPAQIAKGWAFSPALSRAVQSELSSFDLVHIHSLWCYPNRVVRQASLKFGVPYVVRPAGSLEPWSMGVSALRKQLYFQAIEKANLNHATAVHAMSRKEAEHIGAYGLQPPIWTIPNGVDPISPLDEEVKKRVRMSLGIAPDASMIVFLGRLHPVKNLSFLLDVFRDLRTQHPEVHLVLAGPDQGSYAETLKRQVADEGLHDCVTFYGEIRGDEKVALLQTADALCLPSLSENFGNVVLEALASGTAVFASDTTPWTELDGWGCGRCLPLEHEVWVSALATSIASGGLPEWGVEARRVAMEHFSWDVVADRLEAAYQEVLAP